MVKSFHFWQKNSKRPKWQPWSLQLLQKKALGFFLELWFLWDWHKLINMLLPEVFPIGQRIRNDPWRIRLRCVPRTWTDGCTWKSVQNNACTKDCAYCSTECVTNLDLQSEMITCGSILTTFELSSIFGGNRDSIENCLEPKIEPPSENIACPNLWNVLYNENRLI